MVAARIARPWHSAPRAVEGSYERGRRPGRRRGDDRHRPAPGRDAPPTAGELLASARTRHVLGEGFRAAGRELPAAVDEPTRAADPGWTPTAPGADREPGAGLHYQPLVDVATPG